MSETNSTMNAISFCVIRLHLDFSNGSSGWATGVVIRTNRSGLCLLTNKHVVDGRNVFPDSSNPSLGVPRRISGELRNIKDNKNLSFSIYLDGQMTWETLENKITNPRRFTGSYRAIDLAAIDLEQFLDGTSPFDISAITEENMYAESHQKAAEMWRQLNIADECFIAGFPMNEGMTPNASFPIFKNAPIASEPQMDQLHYFLVDTASRRGMSGGAVFHRPAQALADDGTMTRSLLQFVGIYSGSFAVPEQGNDQQENSKEFYRQNFGLGIVWTINRAVRPLLEKLAKRAP